LALADFARDFASWKGADGVLGSAELGWQTTEATIQGELDYLLALMADDRDRYMPEILAQADGAPLYWLQLLEIGSGEKAGTHALISFAQRAGETAALYFKEQYKRVRPSELCPGLLIPFGPPRHPAFPSGHSLTGHLTSLLLCEIPKLNAEKKVELDWLAARVAKNRERAGLHYPSDSAAGAKIAAEIHRLLIAGTLATTAAGEFKTILADARADWT
jgi:hypothetical protein